MTSEAKYRKIHIDLAWRRWAHTAGRFPSTKKPLLPTSGKEGLLWLVFAHEAVVPDRTNKISKEQVTKPHRRERLGSGLAGNTLWASQ